MGRLIGGRGPCTAPLAVVGSIQPAEHKSGSGQERPGLRWGVGVGGGCGGVTQCSGALDRNSVLLQPSTCKKISEVTPPAPV